MFLPCGSIKPFRNLRTIVPGFVRAKNNAISSKNSRAQSHTGQNRVAIAG